MCRGAVRALGRPVAVSGSSLPATARSTSDCRAREPRVLRRCTACEAGRHSERDEVLAAGRARGCGRRRQGVYSHGMQKRLSLARALLIEPACFSLTRRRTTSTRRRRLVLASSSRSAARQRAGLWATQRLDEIRGFADRVTLLARRSSASTAGSRAHGARGTASVPAAALDDGLPGHDLDERVAAALAGRPRPLGREHGKHGPRATSQCACTTT